MMPPVSVLLGRALLRRAECRRLHSSHVCRVARTALRAAAEAAQDVQLYLLPDCMRCPACLSVLAAVLQRVLELKDFTTICSSAPSEVLALIGLRRCVEGAAAGGQPGLLACCWRAG